jgi:hypothetical protein
LLGTVLLAVLLGKFEALLITLDCDCPAPLPAGRLPAAVGAVLAVLRDAVLAPAAVFAGSLLAPDRLVARLTLELTGFALGFALVLALEGVFTFAMGTLTFYQ